ncbi:hypothetical protein JCM10449v2_006046 [Rhodotorula kratochvilovae]
MAAPAARTASALRALTSAARRPQRVAACCTAPAPRYFSTARVSLSPSSSSSPSSPLPPNPTGGSGTYLYAPAPAAQHAFLSALLAPLGARALPNPDVLDVLAAEKALTHKSGVDKGGLYRRREDEYRAPDDEGGRNGHNEKLAFVGRRALRLHLTQHLFTRLSASHPALLTQALSASSRHALSLDAILDTKNLGAGVGRAWRVEDALRWREVRGQDGEMTGLYKCRGSAVEAVVGAVYTTQGIEASSQLFEQLILPHLDFPRALSAALSGAPAPSTSAPVVDDVPQPSVQEAVQA